MTEQLPDGRFAGFASIGSAETLRANRTWWDREARAYRTEHETDLAGRLVWGPEGLDEASAGLLGDVAQLAGQRVLEVGAGAGDGAAWLQEQGARAVASDLSIGMLRERLASSGGSDSTTGAGGRPGPLPRIQADARRLPFRDDAFDLALTAYGALQFVADPELIHHEVARVLRPGGRWVFSLTHPIRWAFPDDPGPDGLTATRSYFDRTPYLETGPDGTPLYAEHHRTLGDQIRMIVAAGFTLEDLAEPEWPDDLERSWGGWSPHRGQVIPGTAIFVCSI